VDRVGLRRRAEALVGGGEEVELGRAILALLDETEPAPDPLARGGRQLLTRRQAGVLRAILDHKAAHGCAPTLRELQVALGFASANGVQDHLRALERKGYLARTFGQARSLRARAADGTLY